VRTTEKFVRDFTAFSKWIDEYALKNPKDELIQRCCVFNSLMLNEIINRYEYFNFKLHTKTFFTRFVLPVTAMSAILVWIIWYFNKRPESYQPRGLVETVLWNALRNRPPAGSNLPPVSPPPPSHEQPLSPPRAEPGEA